MRFAFVPCVLFSASFAFAGTPTTTIDPSADYFKIDMTRPPPPPTPVYVLNFPEVQEVEGTVAVSNLPTMQTVSGTVNVGNLPLDASGSLRVSDPTGRFIGVTTTAVSGGAGWRNLNLACNAEFGATSPTARMCTSKDILKTPVIQWPTLSGDAWVQPMTASAALAIYNGSGSVYGGFQDMSGVVVQNPQELSCNGWGYAGTGNGFGLVLKSNGGFGVNNCIWSTTFVTCCADAAP